MASVSGYLTQKISSTVSSPTVNYSVEYAASRADRSSKTVSVKLTFRAWLNSARSRLGTGIKLTVFARINGGAWQWVVIKDGAKVWNSAAEHKASLTLSASVPADTAKIEFYVSRDGSDYGGTAGVLGSASAPKSWKAGLPAYAAANTAGNAEPSGGGAGDTADGRAVYCRVGGVWKRAVPYVKSGGVWRRAVPYVRAGGVWKST